MNRKKIIGLFLTAGIAVNTFSPFGGVAYAEAAATSVKDIAGSEYVTIAKAGKDYAYVRGSIKQIKAPYIKDAKVYMSLRDLAEITNSPIEWNKYTRKAVVYYLQYELEISDGSNVLLKKLQYDNSVQEIIMPGAAEIIDDMIYIPAESYIKGTGLPYAANGEYITFGRERFTDDEITAASADYSGLFSDSFDENRIMKIFYIDPAVGRDEGMGTSDDPFKSINGAKLYIREYKKNNPMTGNIIVYLRGGNYSETAGVTFLPEDSGENGYHIKYMAYPGEIPHITSAKKFTDWQLYDSEKNIYASFVGKGTMFQYMAENEEQAIPARWPNDGYLHARAADSGPSKTDFYAEAEDIPHMAEPTSARIYMWPGGANGVYMWFSDYYGIGDFNAETGAIKLTSDASYVIGTGTAYYYENAYEFLDMPGEFYNVPDGWVYYIPKSENINESNIMYTTGKEVFSLKGTAEENISGLEFIGLNISTTDRGKDAININYGQDIVIDDCNIHETGRHGVYMNMCKDVTVTDSLFKNIGRSGVLINNSYNKPEYFASGYVNVSNNIIDSVGNCYGDASGVQIAGSDFCYIGNNTISHSPRFGVCVNGQKHHVRDSYGLHFTEWGPYTTGRCNVVSNNDIGYAMDESQDGGAIYGWCTGDGNVIRRNNIYGVSVKQSFGFGIYLDDGWSNCWIYDNIIANNQTEPAGGVFETPFVLKGTDNHVYNNLTYNNDNYDGEERERVTASFVTCPMAGMPNHNLYVCKNVFMNTGHYTHSLIVNEGKFVESAVDKQMAEQDKNIYYSDYDNYNIDVEADGIDKLEDWLMWQGRRYDQNSLFDVNPVFVDAENGDFRFMYNSPAYGMEIEDIDFSQIGLSGYNRYADSSKPIKELHVMNAVTNENSTTRMTVGEKAILEVTGKTEELSPVDMSKASVTFTSDNTAVATVDNSGNVTAVGKGVAKLTAAAQYNGATATEDYWIVVSDDIESIEFIVPDTTYLKGSERETFVKAKTFDGRHFVPENVTYSSSDASVATVDEKGVVTFNKAGTAQLTATVKYDGKTVSDTKDVLVRDALFDKTKISVESKMVKVGDEVPINIEAWDSAGNSFNTNEIDVTIDEVEGMSVISENGRNSVVFNSAGAYAMNISCVADSVKTTEKLQIIAVNDDTLDESWKVSSYGDGTTANAKITKNGEFEYETRGIDLWGKADSGSMAYKEITLDADNPKAEVIAEFHSWPGTAWEDGVTKCKAQVGVVMREKDAAGAKHVTYRWGENDATPFTWRPEENAGYKYAGTMTVKQDHVWMRIVRDGNKFTGYMKLNEEDDWTETASCEVEMGNEILIGITGYSTTQEKSTGAVGRVTINTGDDVTVDSNTGEVYEVSDALKNYKPLLEKDEITVVYLGGSHVQGSSASLPKYNYVGRTTAFLQQAFPDKKVTGVNAGVGGTGSNYGILRLKRDVIDKNPDIVMIEWSGNDAGYDQSEVKKQMEGIVRQLLEMEQPPMIFFMYVPRYEKDAQTARGTHTEVANRYGIPVIDCHEYVWNTYWGKYPGAEEMSKFFKADNVHYTDYGYEVQCAYIRECLNNPEKYLKYANQGASALTDYYDISGKYVSASEAKKVSGWNESAGTVITSKTVGDTVTYEFTGNVFAIRGSFGRLYGKYSVQIDNGTPKTVTAYYEPTENSKVLLYSDFNLSDGKHTVTIKNLEGMNTIDEFIVSAE